MIFRCQLIRGPKSLAIALYDWPKEPVLPTDNTIGCERVYDAPGFFIWRCDTVELRVVSPAYMATDGHTNGLFLPGRQDMATEGVIVYQVPANTEYIDPWIERFQVAHMALNGYECPVMDLRIEPTYLAMETVG